MSTQAPEPAPDQDAKDVLLEEDAVGEDAQDEGSPGDGRADDIAPDRA